MSRHTKTVDLLPNIHPGDILLEDYIEPMGLTKNALATALDVPATRIGEITRGTRAITAPLLQISICAFFAIWVPVKATGSGCKLPTI